MQYTKKALKKLCMERAKRINEELANPKRKFVLVEYDYFSRSKLFHVREIGGDIWFASIDRDKAQTMCNLMNLAQNKTIWALAKEQKNNENIA